MDPPLRKRKPAAFRGVEKEPEVFVRHSERVMTIVLNRPHEINALTTEMVQLIRQAADYNRSAPYRVGSWTLE